MEKPVATNRPNGPAWPGPADVGGPGQRAAIAGGTAGSNGGAHGPSASSDPTRQEQAGQTSEAGGPVDGREQPNQQAQVR